MHSLAGGRAANPKARSSIRERASFLKNQVRDFKSALFTAVAFFLVPFCFGFDQREHF
jgi:hypothetical protein